MKLVKKSAGLVMLKGVLAFLLNFFVICNALHSGYLTFSPRTSPYSDVCPDVTEYRGRLPISMNAVQFRNGNACGKCIRILKSKPSRIQKDCVVTNILPQGNSGDIDAHLQHKGRSRVTWEWDECVPGHLVTELDPEPDPEPEPVPEPKLKP